MILKLTELRVVAFTKFAKDSKNSIVTLQILSTKNIFITAAGYYFILACQVIL